MSANHAAIYKKSFFMLKFIQWKNFFFWQLSQILSEYKLL